MTKECIIKRIEIRGTSFGVLYIEIDTFLGKRTVYLFNTMPFLNN